MEFHSDFVAPTRSYNSMSDNRFPELGKPGRTVLGLPTTSPYLMQALKNPSKGVLVHTPYQEYSTGLSDTICDPFSIVHLVLTERIVAGSESVGVEASSGGSVRAGRLKVPRH